MRKQVSEQQQQLKTAPEKQCTTVQHNTLHNTTQTINGQTQKESEIKKGGRKKKGDNLAGNGHHNLNREVINNKESVQSIIIGLRQTLDWSKKTISDWSAKKLIDVY